MAAGEGRLIRPLLGVTREQTAAYCDARGLSWREDDEQRRRALRARARAPRRCCPALRAVHPAAEANVLRTAALLREETELLEDLVAAELGGRRSVTIARLRELPAALARLVVVRLAEQAAGDYVPQAGDRVQELLALGRRGGRAELHVGGQAGAVIRRRRAGDGQARRRASKGEANARRHSLTGAAGRGLDSRAWPAPRASPASPHSARCSSAPRSCSGVCVELGEEISRDYAGRPLLLVGVLKGAVFFLSDLMRYIDIPVEVDFMAVASYGSATDSSGVVRILKDLDAAIEGRDVLIVEDIVDSGLTLQYLLRNLGSRNPRTLEVCALLTKPERRKVDLPTRYVGFEIPDRFVVGYGLDYAERYRNLPFVAALER